MTNCWSMPSPAHQSHPNRAEIRGAHRLHAAGMPSRELHFRFALHLKRHAIRPAFERQRARERRTAHTRHRLYFFEHLLLIRDDARRVWILIVAHGHE